MVVHVKMEFGGVIVLVLPATGVNYVNLSVIVVRMNVIPLLANVCVAKVAVEPNVDPLVNVAPVVGVIRKRASACAETGTMERIAPGSIFVRIHFSLKHP